MIVAPVVGGLGLGVLGYVTYRVCTRNPKVNFTVEKDNPKVATMVDIEDLGEKAAYCRCWRSKKVSCW